PSEHAFKARFSPAPAGGSRVDPARSKASARLLPVNRSPEESMMHARVQFPQAIEPLVQFVEETAPDEILDRTLEKLRAGVDPRTMLTASALAVVRSSDLPPGHHGGSLHPLAGLHAIANLTGRLSGEDRFLPILQHVALSNKHIHDP